MVDFRYNSEKNELLKKVRGFNFEDAVKLMRAGHPYDIEDHPNRERYSHQKMIVVEVAEYYYRIPCVIESDDVFFLKTIFADRKLTKKRIKRRLLDG